MTDVNQLSVEMSLGVALLSNCWQLFCWSCNWQYFHSLHLWIQKDMWHLLQVVALQIKISNRKLVLLKCHQLKKTGSWEPISLSHTHTHEHMYACAHTHTYTLNSSNSQRKQLLNVRWKWSPNIKSCVLQYVQAWKTVLLGYKMLIRHSTFTLPFSCFFLLWSY